METYYARAFAEFILLISNARMIFIVKKFSFYKHSYVFVIYGLSLATSALGVFRYGNPVYGPKIKQVYELFKKLYSHVALPFFLIEFYFYQFHLKPDYESSINWFKALFYHDMESNRILIHDLMRSFIPTYSEHNPFILILRFLGVLVFHFIFLCGFYMIMISFRLFQAFDAVAFLNIGYIVGIFLFSIWNGTGTLSLWGLAVMISAFMDKFVLSPDSELGWRLGIPVVLDELRILNLVFFTVFSAKALTD